MSVQVHIRGPLIHTMPGVPVLPMKANIIKHPVTSTDLLGTPHLHWHNLRVMNSGPVWPCRASVYNTLEATYMELTAQVKEARTKIALKKWAALGIPASTTAMM